VRMMRSSLFKVVFYIWTALFCIFYLPLMWLPRNGLIAFQRVWSYGILVILKIFMNINLKIKGRENIPAGGAIFAVKHQSSFDTFIMHTLVSAPAFVMKKELLKIPLYGSFCLNTGMIPIDRNGGLKSLKDLMKKSATAVDEGRQVIIFPEGSRIIPGDSGEYQTGIYGIYKFTKEPVIPVALNSGLYWPKFGHLVPNGDIIFDFMPAIEPGKSKEEFMGILEQKIELSSNQMIEDNAHK